MQHKVVGIRRTVFTPKGETGEISGFSLYLEYEDKNVKGVACERVFVSDGKLPSGGVGVGDVVVLNYNKYGKVASVDVL